MLDDLAHSDLDCLSAPGSSSVEPRERNVTGYSRSTGEHHAFVNDPTIFPNHTHTTARLKIVLGRRIVVPRALRLLLVEDSAEVHRTNALRNRRRRRILSSSVQEAECEIYGRCLIKTKNISRAMHSPSPRPQLSPLTS